MIEHDRVLYVLNLTVIFTFVNLVIVNYSEVMPVVLNHVSILIYPNIWIYSSILTA